MGSHHFASRTIMYYTFLTPFYSCIFYFSISLSFTQFEPHYIFFLIFYLLPCIDYHIALFFFPCCIDLGISAFGDSSFPPFLLSFLYTLSVFFQFCLCHFYLMVTILYSPM